ncbi:hypothetical protein AKUH4B114J_12100 [Apilactobacillus kunkeei]|nr:hypothetical protein AKUH4B114J_12100 [Apilactobacillus kunkeei]
MMPAVTMGANSLPKDLISDGTAVISTFRQFLDQPVSWLLP